MSDTEPIEAAVLDILCEVLNESLGDLRAQPILAVHNWDSVASLEVLALLEARLGVTLDLRTYHGARTLDDLVHLVATAVAAKATTGGR